MNSLDLLLALEWGKKTLIRKKDRSDIAGMCPWCGALETRSNHDPECALNNGILALMMGISTHDFLSSLIKDIEWSGGSLFVSECLLCGRNQSENHNHDCPLDPSNLAKMLEIEVVPTIEDSPDDFNLIADNLDRYLFLNFYFERA